MVIFVNQSRNYIMSFELSLNIVSLVCILQLDISTPCCVSITAKLVYLLFQSSIIYFQKLFVGSVIWPRPLKLVNSQFKVKPVLFTEIKILISKLHVYWSCTNVVESVL